MTDRFRIRIYDREKRLHVDDEGSEGEAAAVMETVRARNGWCCLALISGKSVA